MQLNLGEIALLRKTAEEEQVHCLGEQKHNMVEKKKNSALSNTHHQNSHILFNLTSRSVKFLLEYLIFNLYDKSLKNLEQSELQLNFISLCSQ